MESKRSSTRSAIQPTIAPVAPCSQIICFGHITQDTKNHLNKFYATLFGCTLFFIMGMKINEAQVSSDISLAMAPNVRVFNYFKPLFSLKIRIACLILTFFSTYLIKYLCKFERIRLAILLVLSFYFGFENGLL